MNKRKRKPREFDSMLLGVTKEEAERINLNGAEIVRRQYLSHMKENVVSLRPDGVQFNNSCIVRMEDVEYIYLIVKRSMRWLIIKGCDKDDCDGQRWCNIKNGERKTRKITGKPFASRIYSMMGWNKGYYYKVCGTPALQEDDENEILMVFRLDEAEIYPLTAKARDAAGVDDDEIGEEELSKLSEIEKQREKERAERAAEKATGKVRTHKKKADHFPASWGTDSFGIPVEDHEARVIVPFLNKDDQSEEISFFGKEKKTSSDRSNV